MASRVFGNTLYSLRGAGLLAVVLSLTLALLVYFMAPLTGAPLERAANSALLGLVVLAIFALGILPTCLLSLRIDGSRISHVLLGRISLSSKPLAELRSITIGRSLGATLTFSDGTKIRFLGARLEFLRDLCDELRALCGESLRIETATWASTLLSIGGKPARLPNTSLERTRER